MPRMKPEDLGWFLRQPYVGVLATLRRDGRPYTVPVWWLWHEERIWLTGTYERVWCRQLLRDPRTSLCIETAPETPLVDLAAQAPLGSSFAGHVEFDGRAAARELPGFDIWPISRKLVEKYLGRDDPTRDAVVERFFENMQTEHRLLFELVPEVRRAIDMRVYRGKRGDRVWQEKSAGRAD